MLRKDIEWTKVFAGIKRMREIKLRWFQTKICYIILVTNSVLKDTGVLENNICNFCLTEKDTIFHFLCRFEHTQSFGVRFEMCLKESSFKCAWFSINPTLILFGHDGKTTTDEGFDFILLQAKFFVHKCRLNKVKPTLEAFINNLKHIYEVDKHVHLMEMTYEKFVKKWTLYNHLVTWMCLMTFVCTSVNLTCLTCVLLETMYAHTHINVYLLCFDAMMTKYNL